MTINNRIGLANLAISILFLGLTVGVVFFEMRLSVQEEVDESLKRRRDIVIRNLESGKITPQNISRFGDIASDEWVEIRERKGFFPHPAETFETFSIEEKEKGGHPHYYRRLTVFAEVRGMTYECIITRSLLEWDEVAAVMFRMTALAILLLVGVLYGANMLILNRTLEPFYRTVRKLSEIRDASGFRITFPVSPTEEINTLHSALNVMLEHIERYFNEQKEFLQNASHELMTPLAILRQKTEALLEEKALPESSVREIAAIQETLSRIGRLSSSLLLLSKIENRQFPEMKKIGIKPVLTKIVEELEDFTAIKEVTLKINIEADAEITANPDLLHILFYNLTLNAVKFSSFGSQILIFRIDSADGVEIAVQNEGETIPAERLSDIFSRFKKVHSGIGGAGLGLAIVKSICEAHHFGYRVVSENKKTTFFIRILRR